MTGWKRHSPTTRLFALVLVNNASVPVVAQYEPRLCLWLEPDGAVVGDRTSVEWHPLPRHAAFDAKTHALETEVDGE